MTITSTSGRSSRISRPHDPLPSRTSGSSYGCTSVRPRSSRISSRRWSDSPTCAPWRTTSAPYSRQAATFEATAPAGITTVIGTPASRAAHAYAWPALPGRDRDRAAAALVGRERRDPGERGARLERAGLLEVLRLEVQALVGEDARPRCGPRPGPPSRTTASACGGCACPAGCGSRGWRPGRRAGGSCREYDAQRRAREPGASRRVGHRLRIGRRRHWSRLPCRPRTPRRTGRDRTRSRRPASYRHAVDLQEVVRLRSVTRTSMGVLARTATSSGRTAASDWTAPDAEVCPASGSTTIRRGRRPPHGTTAVRDDARTGRPPTRIRRSTTRSSSGPRCGSRCRRSCSPRRCRRCRAMPAWPPGGLRGGDRAAARRARGRRHRDRRRDARRRGGRRWA